MAVIKDFEILRVQIGNWNARLFFFDQRIQKDHARADFDGVGDFLGGGRRHCKDNQQKYHAEAQRRAAEKRVLRNWSVFAASRRCVS